MPALSTSLSSQISSIISEIKVLAKRRRSEQRFWKCKLVMGKMGKPLDLTKRSVVCKLKTNNQVNSSLLSEQKENAKNVRANSERTLITKFEKQKENLNFLLN